jgi:uncharacterized protein YbjT (DUF2867 family)
MPAQTDNNHRILVVGGTGMLGRPVAQRLHAEGFRVRVMSRTPEKARASLGESIEIVPGDVADRLSLEKALDGCWGVHINLDGGPCPEDFDRIEHRGTAAVTEVARQTGIQQITYLSAYTTDERSATSPSALAKLNAEKAIQASGIPYTIFRATWFMESLPLFVQGRRAMLIGRQPHPLHWLAADDYARMVAHCYRTPAARSKVLYAYGPQPFTMADALNIYCRETSLDTSLTYMPTWALSLLGTLAFNAELKSTATVMAYYDQHGETGSPAEADALLGKPATTLVEWCRARREQ